MINKMNLMDVGTIVLSWVVLALLAFGLIGELLTRRSVKRKRRMNEQRLIILASSAADLKALADNYGRTRDESDWKRLQLAVDAHVIESYTEPLSELTENEKAALGL